MIIDLHSIENYRFKTYGYALEDFSEVHQNHYDDTTIARNIVIQNITQRNSNVFRASFTT
jgi:hypothetical protein